ncbi:MAG: hypothetical protein QG657_4780 [Acidobacteriota bacterium]|nr:hypothetical protein [Acidobacteriota bacterium]
MFLHIKKISCHQCPSLKASYTNSKNDLEPKCDQKFQGISTTLPELLGFCYSDFILSGPFITAMDTEVTIEITICTSFFPAAHGLEAARKPSSRLSTHAALVSVKKQWPTEHTENTENPAHELHEFSRIKKTFVHRLHRFTLISIFRRGEPMCSPFPLAPQGSCIFSFLIANQINQGET